MEQWNPFEWFLLAVMLGLMFMGYTASLDRLSDPNDQTVIELAQLTNTARLSGRGHWLVVIYRQSGNSHSSFEVQGDAALALREVLSTFRRAKIDAVAIRTNSADELNVVRLFHNHRGRAEGKRVGGAVIKRV